MHKCQQVSNIQELNKQYTGNTEKIILLQKQQIKTNTQVLDFVKQLEFIKNIAMWTLGLLISLLITVIGGLVFILWELNNIPK